MHLKPEELGRGHYHLRGDPEPDLVLWALDQSPRLVHQQGFEESIIDTPSRCTNGQGKGKVALQRSPGWQFEKPRFELRSGWLQTTLLLHPGPGWVGCLSVLNFSVWSHARSWVLWSLPSEIPSPDLMG